MTWPPEMNREHQKLNLTIQSNFAIQEQNAAILHIKQYREMLDEGWIEVYPGTLRSPDGNSEVSFE